MENEQTEEEALAQVNASIEGIRRMFVEEPILQGNKAFVMGNGVDFAVMAIVDQECLEFCWPVLTKLMEDWNSRNDKEVASE